jgi:hypothetical protein
MCCRIEHRDAVFVMCFSFETLHYIIHTYIHTYIYTHTHTQAGSTILKPLNICLQEVCFLYTTYFWYKPLSSLNVPLHYASETHKVKSYFSLVRKLAKHSLLHAGSLL